MFFVAAFYNFKKIDSQDLDCLKTKILSFMKCNNILGTVLLAQEGINATVSSETKENLELLAQYVDDLGLIKKEIVKWSTTSIKPFKKCLVKIKPEIVTLGEPGAKPYEKTGELIAPSEWDNFLNTKKPILIDCRNNYECAEGTFKGAINPKTEVFTEFKDYIDKELADKKDADIAMVCTGGIRCEKATAYMYQQGFKKLYQLHGGILKYLEERGSSKDCSWENNCFIFDERDLLNKNLTSTKEN